MRTLSLIAAIALVVVPGVLHGLWNERWGRSPGLEQAVARLEYVPLTVGDWQAQPLEMDPRQQEQAEIAGYVMRRYENRRNGSSLLVILICGRPGPVAVHAPQLCIRGAGYALLAPPARLTAGHDSAAFWTAQFRKEGAIVPAYLRLFWSWNAAGAWEAGDNPRLSYARFAALYKLCVLYETGSADERPEQGPGLAFLNELLPELQKALFPES